MGKADRIRQQNARERIAAQQAAARRAERTRQFLIAGGAVVVVLAVVVTFVIIKLSDSTAQAGRAKAGSSQAAAVVAKLASVPAATLDSVGTGTAYAKAIQQIKPAQPILTSGGKPLMMYVGGEFCPYCAAERWAMTMALSRFGTFTGVGLIHSSASDVYANTPTLTFYKSTYTSKYLTFEPIEARNETDTANLMPLTAQAKALMAKYDAPPYVPSSQYDGSFPFVDFGNQYVIDGASYSPQVLAGKTWSQVAAAMSDPASPIAKGAGGAANLITAAICKMTKGQPGNVCTASGVVKASGSL